MILDSYQSFPSSPTSSILRIISSHTINSRAWSRSSACVHVETSGCRGLFREASESVSNLFPSPPAASLSQSKASKPSQLSPPLCSPLDLRFLSSSPSTLCCTFRFRKQTLRSFFKSPRFFEPAALLVQASAKRNQS